MELLIDLADEANVREENLKVNVRNKQFDDQQLVYHRISNHFNNAHLSDITLSVGGKKFFAHKFILAASSDVFEGMFFNWPTEKEMTLEEEDDCIEVFAIFLRYLYSGFIEVCMAEYKPLFVLADKYNVESLANTCVMCIKNGLQTIKTKSEYQSVLDWYEVSKRIDTADLKQQCLSSLVWNFDNFVNSNFFHTITIQTLTEILMSPELEIDDEYTLFMALCNWLLVTSRELNIEENCRTLMKFVRFSTMEPQELMAIPNAKLLQNDCCRAIVEAYVAAAHVVRSCSVHVYKYQPDSISEALYRKMYFLHKNMDWNSLPTIVQSALYANAPLLQHESTLLHNGHDICTHCGSTCNETPAENLKLNPMSSISVDAVAHRTMANDIYTVSIRLVDITQSDIFPVSLRGCLKIVSTGNDFAYHTIEKFCSANAMYSDLMEVDINLNKSDIYEKDVKIQVGLLPQAQEPEIEELTQTHEENQLPCNE